MKKYHISFSLLAPLILTAIAVIICAQNFVPGTFLSGWDTIHPEFNLFEYFTRTLSVWQEHQGLGAVASQAHAAELPRLLLFSISYFLFPESVLRFFYFFLTLIIGPLGVYYFIREFVVAKTRKLSAEVVAFCGGLLYLLNLATVQHYFVPLEMFATHYASLGWFFLFATKFLFSHKMKFLWLFVLAIVLSAPSAHTPTLFYMFYFVFGLYIILLKKTISHLSFKKVLITLLLPLVLNLYWLLPNFYYIENYGESVANSKIHYQFSDRAFQIGENFGNIVDTALLRNFLFDWGEYDENKGYFVDLLKSWKDHLNNPFIMLIGLGVFFTVIMGIITSIKKKQYIALSFIPVFIVPFFFISNDNIIFQNLISFIQNKVPLLKESLRFPFTKFSILLLFSYCIYFSLALAYGIDFMIKQMTRVKRWSHLDFSFREKIVSLSAAMIITAALLLYMVPAFSGNLIDKGMKVDMPDYYFQMYYWFDTQDKSQRIAPFPVHSFWGWTYHQWGFEGAGFNWFGFRQPLLDREFDRWMPYNENYYWEVSNAVYSQNLPLLESVLDKYQVKWLMVDWSVLDASSAKAPYLPQFESLIKKSKRITFEKQFGEIKIYKFKDTNPDKQFVTVFDNLPTVSPIYRKNNNDQAYTDNGNYVSLENGGDTFYPFRSLFGNRAVEDLEYTIEETKESFIFKAKVAPEFQTNYVLKSPDLQNQLMIWFDEKNLDQMGYFAPTVSMQNGQIQVSVPKTAGYYSQDLTSVASSKLEELKNCDYLSDYKKDSERSVQNEKITDTESGKTLLRISSKLANNCSAQVQFPNLSHKYSYLIAIEHRNVKNKSLLFWLENTNARKNDIEVYLPNQKSLSTSYFVQPPMEEYGQGYALHFDNWSFNKNETINDLGRVAMYPIPYELLTQLKLVKVSSQKPETVSSCQIDVNHSVVYFYTVRFKNSCQNKTVVLNQSFDSGWVAFSVDNLNVQFQEHLLINNWSNGWKITTDKKTVYLFFLPQLLQWSGYLIFLVTLIVFLQRSIFRSR